ncbi:MAG: DUF2177 family protein, partial [Anaerolineales bacterium]|nr:DUF2177 family protein [Anaerolineales bacterium]
AMIPLGLAALVTGILSIIQTAKHHQRGLWMAWVGSVMGATGMILMYIENVGNPRKFITIAREVTRTKPVAAVKSGRSLEFFPRTETITEKKRICFESESELLVELMRSTLPGKTKSGYASSRISANWPIRRSRRCVSGDAMQPIIWAALLVYIAIPAGIVLFALPRVSADNIVGSSLFWGALYGIIVYTIYDMTNYSLLRDWPLRVSLIDICWGGFLNATGTLVAAYLDRWLK